MCGPVRARTNDMNSIQKLRQEIVDRSLQAFRSGLFTGTSGNMSFFPAQRARC